MSHLPGDRSGQGSEDGAFARDLPHLADTQLEELIPQLQRSIDVAQTRLALAAAEHDRRGIAKQRHVLTTKQWLAHACRISPSLAASTLRVGRALADMPTTTGLALTGSITTAAVRKLTSARDRHPAEYPLHEAVLAQAASRLRPKDITRAINHWEQQIDYPSTIAEIASKRRRRRLSVSQTWDGMYAVTGLLDPESGYIVKAAIEATVEQGNLDATDIRTHAQKAADALSDICSQHLQHGTLRTSGGVKPHVTVTIDHTTLLDRIEAAGALPEIDGLAITPEQARRLACDASIIPIVLGSDSQILDVGRTTRTIPNAVRRALDLRDGGCTWLGCDAPPPWCDAHHVVHWAHGGATFVDNLRLLCRRHHTTVHDDASEAGPNEQGPDPPLV